MSDEEEERIKAKILRSGLGQVKNETQPYKSSAPVVVTDTNFSEFIKVNQKAVIDCWAEWCYPCKIISPVVEQLAKEYAGQVAFGKLNVDENQATALDYNVMSIPTLLVFKNGELIDRVIGAMPKQMLDQKLKSILN